MKNETLDALGAVGSKATVAGASLTGSGGIGLKAWAGGFWRKAGF